MIIRYIFDKRYREPEIHICADRESLEAKAIFESLQELFEQKLQVYDGEELVYIKTSDIIRIFCSNKQVYLTAADKTYRLRERLYEMEEKLDKKKFVRISNSEIVHVKKIERLDTSITGTIRMYLAGGIETYVSRRYVSRIRDVLSIS